MDLWCSAPDKQGNMKVKIGVSEIADAKQILRSIKKANPVLWREVNYEMDIAKLDDIPTNGIKTDARP